MTATGQANFRILESSRNAGKLGYESMKRGLYVVWDQLVMRDRWFLEMNLSLEYTGVSIGDFWTSSVNSHRNSIAVA